MIVLKKWKLCFLGLVLLAACKSADCDCPMAESSKIIKEVPQAPKTYYKVRIAD